MLVILRENVENLGRIGDAVKVSDGYARNYLLPRNLVVVADEANAALIEHHKKALEKKRIAQRADSQLLAAKIEQHQITLTRKVGEKDKLFGSVNSSDISTALKAAGFPIDKRMVEIPQPIKSLGVHSVVVKIEPEVSAQLKVWVAKEE